MNLSNNGLFPFLAAAESFTLSSVNNLVNVSAGFAATTFSSVLTVAFKASFACCKKPIISSAL